MVGCRRSADCHNGTLPVRAAFDSGHGRGCDLREGLCCRRLDIPGGSSGFRSPVLAAIADERRVMPVMRAAGPALVPLSYTSLLPTRNTVTINHAIGITP